LSFAHPSSGDNPLICALITTSSWTVCLFDEAYSAVVAVAIKKTMSSGVDVMRASTSVAANRVARL
jgi:hypothetical protein